MPIPFQNTQRFVYIPVNLYKPSNEDLSKRLKRATSNLSTWSMDTTLIPDQIDGRYEPESLKSFVESIEIVESNLGAYLKEEHGDRQCELQYPGEEKVFA